MLGPFSERLQALSFVAAIWGLVLLVLVFFSLFLTSILLIYILSCLHLLVLLSSMEELMSCLNYDFLEFL